MTAMVRPSAASALMRRGVDALARGPRDDREPWRDELMGRRLAHSGVVAIAGEPTTLIARWSRSSSVPQT
jgi:hypothetical protein